MMWKLKSKCRPNHSDKLNTRPNNLYRKPERGSAKVFSNTDLWELERYGHECVGFANTPPISFGRNPQKSSLTDTAHASMRNRG